MIVEKPFLRELQSTTATYWAETHISRAKLLLIVISIFVAFFLLRNWDYLLESAEAHPGAAGWVQAVFTVIAVWTAVWLPQRQETRAELKTRARVLSSVYGIVDRAANTLIRLSDEMRNYPTAKAVLERGTALAQATVAYKAATSIPLDELGSEEAASWIIELQQEIAKAISTIEAAAEHIKRSGEHTPLDVYQSSIHQSAEFASRFSYWLATTARSQLPTA